MNLNEKLNQIIQSIKNIIVFFKQVVTDGLMAFGQIIRSGKIIAKILCW